MVKRYDIIEPLGRMATFIDGDYVTHDDYAKLEALCDRLEEALVFTSGSLSTYGPHPIIESTNNDALAAYNEFKEKDDE